MSNIYAMTESGIIEKRPSGAAWTWQFPAKKRYNGGNCKTFCHPPMLVLKNVILEAGSQVTRRRFTDIPGLIREVYASLVESLENRGALTTRPFDDSLCSGATLKDIANEQVTSLVETAEAKGRLALKGSRAPKLPQQRICPGHRLCRSRRSLESRRVAARPDSRIVATAPQPHPAQSPDCRTALSGEVC